MNVVDREKCTTFFLHGNGCDLGFSTAAFEPVADFLGMPVVLVEYPGYGPTAKTSVKPIQKFAKNDTNNDEPTCCSPRYREKPSAAGCVQAALAAIEIMVGTANRFSFDSHFETDRDFSYKKEMRTDKDDDHDDDLAKKKEGLFSGVVLWGHSLGSAVAAQTALELVKTYGPVDGAIRALILTSAFETLRDAARDIAGPIAGALAPQLFDVHSDLAQLAELTKNSGTCPPLLIVHGVNDELVPFSHGLALYHAAPMPRKRIVPLTGRGHNDLDPVGDLAPLVADLLCDSLEPLA